MNYTDAAGLDHDMRMDEQITSAANEIRTWGAVTVIGAGVSLMRGFPLREQLRALIWKAIDSDDQVRCQLSQKAKKQSAAAKDLIGNDDLRTRQALELIGKHPQARQTFQYGFSALNRERVKHHSVAHAILAELIHRRTIPLLISLNWDSLLEVAYRRRYGVSLNGDGPVMFKPHGDAERPDIPWVLPNEFRVLPPALIERVKSLISEERPRVLLVVGYSEQDETIVKALIGPFQQGGRVIRIGPSVTGPDDIPLPLEEALPKLHNAMYPTPEMPGWEYVTFDIQHELGDALLGRRLGAPHVEACPRLPEVDVVKQSLGWSHLVTIAGDSGTGKSITAYQAAFDLIGRGYEVIRLSTSTDLDHAANSLIGISYPTIAIVDDAQSLPTDFRRRLKALTSRNLKVIEIVTSKDQHLREIVEIVPRRAVQVLASALMSQRSETLQAIMRLDDTVGEGYLDTPLERRMREAQEAEIPWQFMFILTGGWRRVRQELATLRLKNEADLLLLAIAMGQIISVDSGASREWLNTAAALLNKDELWLTNTLALLKDLRLVVGDSTLRCIHLRHAEVVTTFLYSSREPDRWDLLIRLGRAALLSARSLRGVSWLLNELRFADGLRFSPHGTLIDDDILSSLLSRCFAATDAEKQRDSCFALGAVLKWHPRAASEIAARIKVIAGWMEEAVGDHIYGIGTLINEFWQQPATRYLNTLTFRGADPARVAGRIGDINSTNAAGWGYFLDRTAAHAPAGWKKSLARALDVRLLKTVAESVRPDELWTLDQLVAGVNAIDARLGKELLRLALPTIIKGLNRSPTDAFSAIRDIHWRVLGFSPFLDKRPTSHRMVLARRLVRGLDVHKIAKAISFSKRREWEKIADLLFFIRQVSPSKAKRIAAEVDRTGLDGANPGMWARPSRELILLVTALGWEKGAPGQLWLETHGDELQALSLRIAAVAPRVAVDKLVRGYKLDLGTGGAFDWGEAAFALHQISRVNRQIAVSVIADNLKKISASLSNLQSFELENLKMFLAILRKLAPLKLQEVVAKIDLEKAKETWPARLSELGRRNNLDRRKELSLKYLASMTKAAGGKFEKIVTRLEQRFAANARRRSRNKRMRTK